MPKQERSPFLELDPDLGLSYAKTFISRYDLYAVQRNDGRYACLRKSLKVETLTAHLRGEVTLGAYALDAGSRAMWVCLDADAAPQWDQLRDLAGLLVCPEIPSYLEPSRRGGHLWLFFEQPIPGSHARLFGRQMLEQHGIEDVELFPKQDRLATGPGSLVRLPLGVHRKDGRRYHFINPDGTPLSPTIREQAALLASPQRVPENYVYTVLATAEEERELRRAQPTGRGSGETLTERLKDRVTVYDFIGQFVTLDEHGKGHCPFHDDQRKSFGVNREGNFWHCFAGCGGGSIIDFWMKWREKHGQSPDFAETLKDLSEMLF